MHEGPTPYRGSFQQLADARRVLRIINPIRSAPVLPTEDRLELERIRALAIGTIEAATEELIETLDALDDADLEDDDPAEENGDELDGTDAEDENLSSRALSCVSGPGCVVSDPDYGAEEAGEREEGF